MSRINEVKSVVVEALSIFGTMVDFAYVNILDLKNLPRARIASEISSSSDEAFESYVRSKLSFKLAQDEPERGLSEYNVAKRAVLQMLLYCRLQKMRSATDVSSIYLSLLTPEPVIINPSLRTFLTVGDYLASEMLVSCSAIRHLHSLTQKFPYKNPMRMHNTYVDHDDASRVLELLFMQLVRHLVAFNEGLMEAIGFRTRFMMSIGAAEHFASRSLAFEKGETVNKRRPSPPTHAVEQGACPAVESPTLLLMTSLDKIKLESDVEGEVQNLTGIKRLYCTYAAKWARQADLFFATTLEKDMHKSYLKIIKDLKKVVDTPVDPPKDPFERIHNRPALAVKVAQMLVEIYWVKVCNVDEDTTTCLRDKMAVCLNNASLYADGIFVPVE